MSGVLLRSRMAERTNLTGGEKFRKDIKLALPLGAALGWLGLVPWLTALLGAHLLYLTVHVTRALAGRTGWRDRHAFGPPMLGAALLAALLVGAA
jgi:hypothetical protein